MQDQDHVIILRQELFMLEWAPTTRVSSTSQTETNLQTDMLIRLMSPRM